jgi:hypothetical protein
LAHEPFIVEAFRSGPGDREFPETFVDAHDLDLVDAPSAFPATFLHSSDWSLSDPPWNHASVAA